MNEALAVNFDTIKKDFPLFENQTKEKPLVFLDSAASAQKPRQVLDAMAKFYSHDYANIHRGIYELSARATKLYENTRTTVADFIHANADEIIFTSGTTCAANLIAHSYGRANLQAGDEIILTEMEHHSNIVPWYMLKEELGVELKVVPVLDDGTLDMQAFAKLLNDKTKIVAVAHASNVLGTINPIKEITKLAHEYGAIVVVDGAQSVSHFPVDVRDLGCDFYTLSAHKLYGPTGVGVLYGKKALLDAMPPFLGGGGMIDTVSFEKITYAPAPFRFEAGTPDIAGVIGLDAAIKYVQEIGLENIHAHSNDLLLYAEQELKKIEGLRIIGTAHPKVAVVSFVIDGIHPHDIGTVLDHENVAIRAGHHCAMPLMTRFGVPATVRASFGIYNNKADVDALVNALQEAKRLFA